MDVGVLLGRRMLCLGALIVVIFVDVMCFAVVHVVDVVAVLNGRMPTGRAVFVVMAGDWFVLGRGGHGCPIP